MADNPQFLFDNGDTLQDMNTDYKGVVVGRVHWQNGCKRYILQSPKLKDGVPIEHTFDEQTLKVVKPRTVSVESKKPIGGPRTTPSRGMAVRR